MITMLRNRDLWMPVSIVSRLVVVGVRVGIPKQISADAKAFASLGRTLLNAVNLWATKELSRP